MDLLNTQAIDANVIDPLLNRLKAELIPQLEAVIQRRVDSAIEQASNVIHGVLVGVQGIEDKSATDVRGILASLDGWTVQVALPPIQLGPVTIRLTKPEV